MSLEILQKMCIKVDSNIEQLERYNSHLHLASIIMQKKNPVSLFQKVKYQQAFKYVEGIRAQVESQIVSHLQLLVQSEELLARGMEYYTSFQQSLVQTESETDKALQNLQDLKESLTSIREVLFDSIYGVGPDRGYELEQQYPTYQPVSNKKREASSAGLEFSNTFLYSFGAKKYHQDTTQLDDDIDLTCDEELGDEHSVFSFRN